MDAELKAKWVKALRSGEYKQAQARLRVGDAYCCLGVLCKIQDADFSRLLGISIELSTYDAGTTLAERRGLAHMNDEGKSFSEIADYIEANL